MGNLGEHVSDEDLAFLLSWGLVVEQADDGTFTYHYGLSALGDRHIATCPAARMHQREAWSALVPKHERPVRR